MFGNVERVDRKPPAQVMRLLAGRVERVAVARGIVIAKIGARLDRVGRQTVVLEVEADDLRCRSHRRLRPVAISALDLEHDVGPELLVHERRGWLYGRDRKSTRLNSSHPSISYAVFCLKKKKKHKTDKQSSNKKKKKETHITITLKK